MRITLPRDFTTICEEDPRRVSLVVPSDAFEELATQIREGDEVRAELKRSLDEAHREVRRLSDDRDHWQEEAENWKRVADSPFRQGLDCSPANVEALSGAVRDLERERDALREERNALRRAQHVAPARMVIHTTAEEKADWTSSDMATADVLDRIAATAPVGSLVDDLKNTIVSQAREIARLKGEGE
ncbi:hypothetical protein [Streptomyces sp. NPDC005907]|uniref:hypothetical protein n=1 Tax=Streptomyces sp. NPDC005907 TaxID=3154571 RepID=UPI00340A55DB